MLQHNLDSDILQNTCSIVYNSLVWGSSDQADRTVMLAISSLGTKIVKERLQRVDSLEPWNLLIHKSLSLTHLENVLPHKPVVHGTVDFTRGVVVTLAIAERGKRNHYQVGPFFAHEVYCMYHTVCIPFLDSLKYNSSFFVSHYKLIFAAVVMEVF